MDVNIFQLMLIYDIYTSGHVQDGGLILTLNIYFT
jgi:hypothetical protein